MREERRRERRNLVKQPCRTRATNTLSNLVVVSLLRSRRTAVVVVVAAAATAAAAVAVVVVHARRDSALRTHALAA